MNKYKKLKSIFTDRNVYTWEDGKEYTMFGIFSCLINEYFELKWKRPCKFATRAVVPDETKKNKYEKIIAFHKWNDKFDEYFRFFLEFVYKGQNRSVEQEMENLRNCSAVNDYCL